MLNLFLAVIISLFQISTTDRGPLKLDWQQHYKAKGDERSRFLALTALVFRYGYGSSIRGNQLKLSFTFEATVDPSKSWKKLYRIRTRQAEQDLLHHEQGHVDINYLQMREAEAKLTRNRYSVKNYKAEIKKIADDVIRKYDEMQKLYDEETGHGTSKVAQQKWDLFINSSLKEYNVNR